MSTYLTGSLPILVDQQHAANHTEDYAAILSVLLILVVLAIAFRAVLGPLVALAPAGLALMLAEPLIAESTHLGVQISSLLELLLTALMLGAGTDYGLFILFRFRENLGRGMTVETAIVEAMSRVGGAVGLSALTVVVALSSLVIAQFGLYRGVGPGLALGIVIVLAVEVTLLPALLSLVGRAAFWPSRAGAHWSEPGAWGRVAARVSGRPVGRAGGRRRGLRRPARWSWWRTPRRDSTRRHHRRKRLGGRGDGAPAVLRGQLGQPDRCRAALHHFGVGIPAGRPRPSWNCSTASGSPTGRPGQSQRHLSGPRAAGLAGGPSGPAADAPAVEPAGLGVSARPMRPLSPAQFISRTEGRCSSPPRSGPAAAGSTLALQAIPGVRRWSPGWPGRRRRAYGVTGEAAGAADVSAVSGSDWCTSSRWYSCC